MLFGLMMQWTYERAAKQSLHHAFYFYTSKPVAKAVTDNLIGVCRN